MIELYAICVRGSDEIFTKTVYDKMRKEEFYNSQNQRVSWYRGCNFNRIQGIYQRRGDANSIITKIKEREPEIGETLYIKEFVEK